MQGQLKQERRDDIDGLLGLSVIFVLLFHYFPNQFPNGYLGVDVYFVLCGFITCKILTRIVNKSAFSLIYTFYSKRFQRILPLYLFSILFTLLEVVWLLPTSSFIACRMVALKATSLVTNQFISGDESYFETSSTALDFFSHTWPICIELQFILLIPLLHVDIINFKSSQTQLFLYSFLTLISFIFYIFCSPVTAFYSTIARIWQFGVGMIVFLMSSEKRLDFKSLEPYKFLMIGALIYLITYSNQISELLARTTITFISGLLLFSSANDKFLSNRMLTYTGHMSFSLYLIHWPIFSYWKIEWEDNSAALIMAFSASILISVIVHEVYEKWTLKLSKIETWLLIIFLFFACFTAIFKNEIMEDKDLETEELGRNFTLEHPAKMNRIWNKNSLNQMNTSSGLGWEGWHYRRDLPLDGTEKLLVFGSSLAANIAKTIQEECQHKSKSFLQGTFSTCEPLFPTSSGFNCSSILDDYHKEIEKEKPDYAFMAARHLDMGKPLPSGIDKLVHDPIYIFAREQMRSIAKNVQKKLFVVFPLPRVVGKRVEKIAKWIKESRKLEEIDKMLVDMEGYEMAKMRYQHLMEDCGAKCVPIDFSKEFLDEKTKQFRFFNFLGFSYFTRDNHFTPFGLIRIRHIFREICTNL